MNKQSNINPSTPQKREPSFSKTKTLLFVLQISFVIVLFVLWFSSESLRESKNLWILFLYSFPSNFLVGIVPYDPAIIYFGKFYSPLYVTFVGVASTLVVEGINYSVLNFASNTKLLVKIRHRKFINKIIKLFNKTPFIALFIAGFLPIPFYPFRFLVVLTRYPLIKYLLTVLLSKTPRIYLLGLLGHVTKIPDYLIISFFIAIVIFMYISFLINHLKKRQKRK